MPRRLNADIQVLRAVAIIMVMVEHMMINLFYWHSSLEDFLFDYWRGAPGVDLFFVISGYVIARSLLPRLRAYRDGVEFAAASLTFLLRRFWRLQPPVWLWIAIPLVLAVTFNRSNAFHGLDGNLPSALTALLAVNNLRSAFQPMQGATPQVLFPYWSLSLEEQFYLLLPVLVFLFRKRLGLVMAILVAYQFVAPWTGIFIQTRPGALAAGVLLAMWRDLPAYRVAEPLFLGRSATIRLLFLCCMVLLLGLTLSGLFNPLQSIRFGLQVMLGSALVYAASFDQGYIMSPGRIRQIFEWIGARSYAIYLVHVPAYALARELLYRWHPPTFVHDNIEAAQHIVLGVTLTLLFSTVTYRFVETPFRRYGRSLEITAPRSRATTVTVTG